MNEPTPIATGKDGAMRYLGITENRFDTLCATGVIKRLANGWYSYEDLKEAHDAIRKKRDQDAILTPHETTESITEKGQTGVVRSEGNRPGYRKTSFLLSAHTGGSIDARPQKQKRRKQA